MEFIRNKEYSQNAGKHFIKTFRFYTKNIISKINGHLRLG